MEVDFYRTPNGRSPIEEFIAELPKVDQARFLDIYQGIKQYGLECPRAIFKPLHGKLWEIKFSGPSGGYRVAYVLVTGPIMVWLHAFKKKTQKTSPLDLQLAEKRMKEVLR
jgi:phage-related protein